MTANAPQTTAQELTRLLRRAQAEGLVARRHHRIAGLTLVTSSQNDHVWYRVTRTSCTCKAHEYHGICKHRALAMYLEVRGDLAPAPVPTPTVKEVIVGDLIPAPRRMRVIPTSHYRDAA